MGRRDESFAEAHIAAQLDPLSVEMNSWRAGTNSIPGTMQKR
jgi:hypothetical protein